MVTTSCCILLSSLTPAAHYYTQKACRTRCETNCQERTKALLHHSRLFNKMSLKRLTPVNGVFSWAQPGRTVRCDGNEELCTIKSRVSDTEVQLEDTDITVDIASIMPKMLLSGTNYTGPDILSRNMSRPGSIRAAASLECNGENRLIGPGDIVEVESEPGWPSFLQIIDFDFSNKTFTGFGMYSERNIRHLMRNGGGSSADTSKDSPFLYARWSSSAASTTSATTWRWSTRMSTTRITSTSTLDRFWTWTISSSARSRSQPPRC